MRKLSIIVLALLLVNPIFAQDEPRRDSISVQKDFHSSLYVYGGIGVLDQLVCVMAIGYGGGLSFPHYDVGILYSQKVSPHWSVGLGTEFHGSQAFNSSYNSMATWFHGQTIWMDKDFHTLPVYANARLSIGKKAVRPYLELKAGYAFSLNTVYGYWRADVYNHTNTEYPEPGFQGPMKAGGIYAAFDAGCNIGRHGVVIGVTCMPIKGDFVDYSTNETLSKEGPMLNFFVRYCFAILK